MKTKNENKLSTIIEQTKKSLINQKRINELLKDEKVLEYIELMKENSTILEQRKEFLLELQKKQMLNCGHIFVLGSKQYEYNGHKTNNCLSYYCVNCGLDNKYSNYEDKDMLTPIQKEMEYIYEKTFKNGVVVDSICNHEKAQEIYNDILLTNPKATYDDIVSLFNEKLTDLAEMEKEGYKKRQKIKFRKK